MYTGMVWYSERMAKRFVAIGNVQCLSDVHEKHIRWWSGGCVQIVAYGASCSQRFREVGKDV